MFTLDAAPKKVGVKAGCPPRSATNCWEGSPFVKLKITTNSSSVVKSPSWNPKAFDGCRNVNTRGLKQSTVAVDEPQSWALSTSPFGSPPSVDNAQLCGSST